MKRVIESIIIVVSLLGLLSLYGCPYRYPKREFPIGEFPDTVCNLLLVNSEYDDINMDLMEVNCANFLVFSSNRNTKGETYDLVTKEVIFSWDQVDGEFAVRDNVFALDDFLEKMVVASSTKANEYGPLFFIKPNGNFAKYYLFYSDDESGTQDVRFFEFEKKNNLPINASFADSIKKEKNTVGFLGNTNFNEGYISFQANMYPSYETYYYYDTTILQRLVYCSDSSGHYDIYSIDIPQNIPLDSFLRLQSGVAKMNL